VVPHRGAELGERQDRLDRGALPLQRLLRCRGSCRSARRASVRWSRSAAAAPARRSRLRSRTPRLRRRRPPRLRSPRRPRRAATPSAARRSRVGARARAAAAVPRHRRQEDAPMNDLRHCRASVSGIELHYVDAGHGPVLMLLHGWPVTWRHWRRLIPMLVADGWRVIAPDLRGLGDSARPESGYSTPILAEDAAGLAATCGGLPEGLHETGDASLLARVLPGSAGRCRVESPCRDETALDSCRDPGWRHGPGPRRRGERQARGARREARHARAVRPLSIVRAAGGGGPLHGGVPPEPGPMTEGRLETLRRGAGTGSPPAPGASSWTAGGARPPAPTSSR